MEGGRGWDSNLRGRLNRRPIRVLGGGGVRIRRQVFKDGEGPKDCKGDWRESKVGLMGEDSQKLKKKYWGKPGNFE